MHRREFLFRTMTAGLAGGTCGLTGCGTLFHSERLGQPHSRDLDWTMVGCDALGLVFFFVPGVVAFAVDFYTGAIYLPHDCDDGCVGYNGAGYDGLGYGPSGMVPTGVPPPPPTAQRLPAQPHAAQPYTAQPHAAQPTPANGMPMAPQFPQPRTQYVPQPLSPQLGSPAVSDFRRLTIPRRELDQQAIEQVVGQQVGRPVVLTDSAARVSQLAHLDGFFVSRERHQADHEFGSSAKQFFARLLSA